MARTINQAVHTIRREAFVDAAQRLAYWRLLKAIYDLPLLGMFARVRPRRGELTSSIGSAGRAYTWLI